MESKIQFGNWNVFSEVKPKFSGIYIVTQDLNDNYAPLSWALWYEVNEDKWFIDDSDTEEEGVIAWMELPRPMETNFKSEKLTPQPINLDEYERVIYGQCVHGENMANCSICNPNN